MDSQQLIFHIPIENENFIFCLFTVIIGSHYNKVNKNNKQNSTSIYSIERQTHMYQSRSNKSQRSTPLKSSRLNLTDNISPVKSEHYKSLNSDKKNVINKLLYLFTFYSSKISKYSYRQLNEKYFVHLISDLCLLKKHKELVKNSIEQKEFINIYFSKGKKNLGAGIKFQDFLQTLPVISVYFCPEIEERQQAVKQVVQAMVLLYETKVASSIEGQVVEYEQNINEQTKQMILKLNPAFKTVYKIYFSHQIAAKFNTNDPAHQSFEALMNMMKDFQVFPKIISASSLFLIYNWILKTPQNSLLQETRYIKQTITEKGQLFTLSKFIELIIACSRITFPKLKNLQNPEYDSAYQKQVFKTFLQYLQTIKSTKTSLKASTLFKENRFSFILLEEYENEDKEQMTKTFVLKDKVVRETGKTMEFFSLFDKMQL